MSDLHIHLPADFTAGETKDVLRSVPSRLDVKRLAHVLAIVQPNILHVRGKDWTPYAERIAAEYAATDSEGIASAGGQDHSEHPE